MSEILLLEHYYIWLLKLGIIIFIIIIIIIIVIVIFERETECKLGRGGAQREGGKSRLPAEQVAWVR